MFFTYKYNTEENNKFQNTRLEGFNDSKDLGHKSCGLLTLRSGTRLLTFRRKKCSL